MNTSSTILRWREKVDVSRWEVRSYVIVDPSSLTLLYLNPTEYQRFSLSALANGVDLMVVATPDTPRELLGVVPPSK